jgi:hypothetical protein
MPGMTANVTREAKDAITIPEYPDSQSELTM